MRRSLGTFVRVVALLGRIHQRVNRILVRIDRAVGVGAGLVELGRVFVLHAAFFYVNIAGFRTRVATGKAGHRTGK